MWVRLLILAGILVAGVLADGNNFPGQSSFIKYTSHPPRIVIRPRDQTVRAGGTAAFYCSASGIPPPSLSWKKNDKRLSNSQSRYAVEAGGGVLRIEPVRTGRDDARYECSAENGVGDAVSATASLTVIETDKLPPGFPVITASQTTKVVEIGHNAVLHCTVSGNPPPRITWIRDMVPIDLPANPRYTVLDSRLPGALQIANSETEDAGKYECVAENSLGTEFSQATQLYVKERRVPPSFSIKPEPVQEVMLGEDVNLTCVAVGSPMPRVMWVKGTDTESTSEFETLVGKNILFLRNVQKSENFTCVAASALGRIMERVLVKVKSLPSAPTKLEVSEITATTVKLSWTHTIPEDLSYYVIQHKPRSATNQAFSEISGIITQYYTVRSLSPYTEYEMYVLAVNPIGRGPRSSALYVTTGETAEFGGSKPGTAPRNVQVRPLSSSTMVIQWDEPETPSGQISGYNVYYTTNPQEVIAKWQMQKVDNSQLTTIGELTPHSIYTIRVQAFTSIGPGPFSVPVQVKTQQGVPSQPSNLRASDIGETSVTLVWNKPTHASDNIVAYDLYWNDTFVRERHHRRIAALESYKLTGLYPNTLYYIWLAARSSRGEGATTVPIPVRTKQYVPGAPKDIVATPINSTAINVRWSPPDEKERNGIIRGYQIHVQEASIEGTTSRLMYDPIRLDIQDGSVLEGNVPGLQPDTNYSVQVAALTRKGDGDRSKPITVRTPGGVPNRPNLNLKAKRKDDTGDVNDLELEWNAPTQKHGELIGFRLRFGIQNQSLQEKLLGPSETHFLLQDLERGVVYEFRLAGQNEVGYGQEIMKTYVTPEGAPTGPPSNISVHFQTPDTVSITWSAPPREKRNGVIMYYHAVLHKKDDHSTQFERNTTFNKAVFPNLEDNSEYIFKVRAHTTKGAGPYSEHVTIKTQSDVLRAPRNVNVVATSDHSAEVWWEPVTSRHAVGYTIFYSEEAVEDLDRWNQKNVSLTESADLTNLDKNSEYAVVIAARSKTGLGRLSEKKTVKVKPEDVPMGFYASDVSTHSMTLYWSAPNQLNPLKYKISYDSEKQFVDSQGITQTQIVPPRTIYVEPHVHNYTVTDLSPFTTYRVNVSAVPQDSSYRPPTKTTVTTGMAAPQPMVQPDFYGVTGDEISVILPQASEQYGPISHYYLIVVPEDKSTFNKNPDQFLTEQMIANKGHKTERENAPYIAAKFTLRNIPYTFYLGNNETYEGFLNRKLEKGKRYRIFIRAVVDTPQKHLYTSSPFSEPLSLNMRSAPPGDPPRRPDPNVPVENSGDVSVNRNTEEAGMVWVIGPIIAALGLSIIMVLLFILKKRRQPCKAPDQAAVTRPLITADIATSHGPMDPVEMRRLNHHTPAMASHPPIPFNELATHIERLKSNDNMKFSQEYESIEPGQQFTWDHSNMEVNKPKNRYANVIAYDHSRVVLQPIDGVLGSDYINANYCDGYRKHNAYVATQGPLQETFADFWRMVWELRTATIVMMTKLEERTRIKCDQYWPTRGSDTYGNITVAISDVQELATYCIRTFHIHQSGYSERREVKQLQFTAWPDHGVPDHPAPFLQFLRRVRSLNPGDAGAMVVHCSAGVGRTGCFIVIDSMLERMQNEKTIDIYGHVTCLRAQRNYMVQTEDQYMFIHDALLEAVVCGNTEVAARSLHTHISNLLLNHDGVTNMELEFKRLSNMKTDASRFLSASLQCNKHKNRLVHVLPFESTRVCLQPVRGVEGSDYINASLIDGYRQRGAYIATQGPLPHTAEDLWRMLWEHNSTIVVMLTKLKEMGREKCHQYWPSDRSVRYACYVVEPIAEYNMPQYILREFKVTDARDGSSRTLRQFQFTDWPEQGVPKSGDGFIDFIGQVHKTKEQFGQEGPITVHCSAGVGRTGVFITLSIVLERMQYEGVVDVFQSVRVLRTQRPAMVQTEDQYQFCYRAALEYLGSFDHYAT
ncbi:tyrosine-protein phosphatase Lar isoform X4 [Frankliniella occidentalis]|uniref:protein-tyrosine-phosphatase n=1 Tax=Frankliniella occidentalis TaxID=133901 RepID=A0A9C6X470_FRAOC|nr:tyrosine-protein phosphatase Lar isoform X4 [Frankliniella occidentalis]